MLRAEQFEGLQKFLVLTSVILVVTAVIGFTLAKTNVYYAVAIAVMLVSLVIIFSNTDAAIFMLILSMLLSPEFGSRGTTGGGVTFRVDDILLVMIIFVWIAKTAIYKELHLFAKTIINRPIALYSFVCFAATGFGIIQGNVKILNGFFFTLKIIQYFFIFFMVSNHLTSKKQAMTYIVAMLITYSLVTFIAIGQIPSGERLTAPFEGKGGEPNTLGGYLVLMMSVNLGFLLTPGSIQSKLLKRSMIAMTIISIVPFLLTNSRSSWLAFIPLIIMFIIVSPRRNVLIVILLIAISTSPFYVPEGVKERLLYTFQEQKGYAAQLQEHIGDIALDTSTSERIRSFKTAWKAFKNKPILGYGITGWKFLDNQYMRVLIETGVFGLAAFLYLLRCLLKESWQIYKKSEDPFFKSLALGFFIGTLAMMTHSVGTNTYIIIRIMEPYWLIASIVFAALRLEEEERERRLKLIS